MFFLTRPLLCRKPMSWTYRLKRYRVNIWDARKYRADKYLCVQPYQEVKFTRPWWLTRHGFPKFSRTPGHEIGSKGEDKYCDMSKIHRQEARRPFQKERPLTCAAE
eukprot:TRINITY_DN11352_c0_g1_i2.p3 TRINITY_DN11352_c0_g1~~TRINITY_DN11352_c0_g1_i2.p3  ORF type:complete len:106 (+),score=13.82 TRINITY_DN11352_c0_g1_i2:105-422(+)